METRFVQILAFLVQFGTGIETSTVQLKHQLSRQGNTRPLVKNALVNVIR